jgi:phosphoserine phosphatase
VILLTGSLDFLMEPIADSLQVDRCVASCLEQMEGVYTGQVVPPLPYGVGKLTYVRRIADELGLDLTACFAYGDSPGDRAVLSAVGHPTVVNPIRGMSRVARRNGWPVVSWR